MIAIEQLRREHLSMNIINVLSNRCYPPFWWSKIRGGLVVIVRIIIEYQLVSRVQAEEKNQA